MVEGEGFRAYSQVLEPRFVVPSRITVARDCMKLYVEEKKALKKLLKSQRVCLTTDTWTSIQNLNYMCLTAHWIDDSWKLQKKILNFLVVENHKGATIGRVIEECLVEWNIEDILTLTVDNASSNDLTIDYLKRNSKWKRSILDNRFLHVRCCAHIVNLIVKDGLNEQSNCIIRIRNAIKYVRSSPSRFRIFKKCVDMEKIESKHLVSLDIDTRWNSTYLMLEHAEKFEWAFKRLEREDNAYALYFDSYDDVEILLMMRSGGKK
ncbi:UNVERIFIED_CONTAM: putative AC transposase [Sesamum radiatum]|uniref:AC transposase n=1 Tax=Sesamum radiatum TaxID=300843 RepID=A0AAW2VP25_SESRA